MHFTTNDFPTQDSLIMPLDASITSEKVNSDFFDGINRGKSQGTGSTRKSPSRWRKA